MIKNRQKEEKQERKGEGNGRKNKAFLKNLMLH